MSTKRKSAAFRTMTPDIVRKGLPASRINEVASIGLDRAKIVEIVGAGSTIRRKLKADAVLNREESDRLARVARITRRAIDVFGSETKAVHWLGRPSRGLTDGHSPLDMLDTDPGAEWVEERLNQIAFGMFA